MMRLLRVDWTFGRAARAFFLLVGFWLGLGGQGWAGAGTHCLRHETHGRHGAPHSPSHPTIAVLQTDCDHCPLQQCTTTMACSLTSTPGVRPSAPALLLGPAHSVVQPLGSAVLGSAAYQPPTPPPQTIA